VTIARPAPTSMAGLRCGEVSLTAWPALAGRVDATVTISDAEAADAIARLAEPALDDPVIAAGPSGAAGLAGFVALMRKPTHARTRAALGLSPASRALVFNTEGPIDR
jgi:diaminopropionate ammonia-lyase